MSFTHTLSLSNNPKILTNYFICTVILEKKTQKEGKRHLLTLFAQIESNSWKMFCIGLSIECRLGCRGDSLRTENVNVQQWKGGFCRLLRQPKSPETEKWNECKNWICVVRGLYRFRKRWCPKTFVVDREEMSNVHPQGVVNSVFSKARQIRSFYAMIDQLWWFAIFSCHGCLFPDGKPKKLLFVVTKVPFMG